VVAEGPDLRCIVRGAALLAMGAPVDAADEDRWISDTGFADFRALFNWKGRIP
jgi:hypothetical protein